MKARVPDKTTLQKLLDEAADKARTDAIKLCCVTDVASLNDIGLAESTIDKKLKKQFSYIQSILKGNVTWQEIAEALKEERGITFEWIEELGENNARKH